MDATEPERLAECLLAGRYRLTAIIGKGGMGVVWQGHDELLDRDVAVKEIIWPPHLTEQEQQVACRRATREAQVAGRLSHRNVVRIYDIVQQDGHPCIVMEFLPYKSLREILNEEGPLPPARAAQIGLGVLGALSAAHAEGILHRDVKPANILVGPDGRVVLTDFGIARAADSPTLTADGAVLGSPSYIAPERARGGQSGAGAPGDLWGLGASLYAAVEGHPPFERNSALATLTAVVADEPDQAKHAGPLEPVISGLLRKDPEQRLGAAEAERLLRRVAEPQPLPIPAPVARPRPVVPGPWPPAPPSPRRSYRLLVTLAALVAAAAAVTGLAFALTSSPGRQGASSGGSPRPASSRGTSAAASPASSPSAGTSQPQAPPSSPATASGNGTGSTAGYGSLPAGYYRFTNSTGFSIGVPNGWQVSHQGHYVYLSDPSDSNIYLLIDQSDHPKPDPLADWEQQQANREGSYPGYRLISLRSVNYPQAEKAADWEFTYDRNGVLVHILNRNILANASHAYALYWSTPESGWSADYHYFQAFAATFRPASGG
ncbi:MAG: Calcium/calmodulin-dependent protein kinase type beta chain [Actinomycetia bacterium]|nr:Calcium/calmodulin-dependent protein kinase type beta chain [Actinomycetes bacterium]